MPCQNREGGLALLWKGDTNVDVLTSSKRHIDAVIEHGMMTLGISHVSMAILIQPVRKIPGLY